MEGGNEVKPYHIIDDNVGNDIRNLTINLSDNDDGLHVRKSFTNIEDLTINDLRSPERLTKAHSDAIQIIPKDENRGWYAGAEIDNVSIKRVLINALGSQLQCITAFDGLLRNITVEGCHFESDSEHEITFNGLMSGFFKGNTSSKGDCKIVLNPLRIGGGKNIKVISFKDMEYQDIYSDIPIVDNRRKVTGEGIFIENFDYKGFRKAFNKMKIESDINLFLEKVERLVKLYGDVVMVKNNNNLNSMIDEVASYLNVEPAAICAVVKVESNNDKDAKLFERHIFYRQMKRKGYDIDRLLLIKPSLSEILSPEPYKIKRGCRSKDCYGSFKMQDERFAKARSLDLDAALESISHGWPQIMGFNYGIAGYDSAVEMVQAFNDEREQMKAFANVITETGADVHLRNKDWKSFKQTYNGNANIDNNYAYKIAREYQRCLAQEQPKKPLNKSKTVGSATATVATTTGAIGGLTMTIEEIRNTINSLESAKGEITELVNDTANDVGKVKDTVGELKKNVDSSLSSIDAMLELVPWIMGGMGVIIIFCIIIMYAYATDHGYIPKVGELLGKIRNRN